MNTPHLGPSFSTAAAFSAAIKKLRIAEKVYARRKGDKWSTQKLNEAKNDVRQAHFHNTMGGYVSSTPSRNKEPHYVTAGFASAEESYW